MKPTKPNWKQMFPLSWRDAGIMVLFFGLAVAVCAVLRGIDSGAGFASPVFVLTVLLVSRFTNGYLYGLISALLGVVCVNYVFTYPYFALNFTISGYPLSFLVFLMVSVITCALTAQAKQKEEFRLENERVTMRANLLRSVSHDIRTPLTSIVGATSAVLDNPQLSEEERRMLLTDVHDDALWLIRVVENLLSITRVGDEDAEIVKQLEAPEEILASAVAKFRKRYPEIAVSVSVPEELLMVPMDAILIEQVLANLMENAAVHGGNTTHIDVKVSQVGDMAWFSVGDDGQGIPADQLQTLFDGSMKHSETAKGDVKRNMGIGLSVCSAIIGAHQGVLSAFNKDRGAEVVFQLPLTTNSDKGVG